MSDIQDEIDKLEDETNKLQDETITRPIIANTNSKGKYTQYKITIPSKFANSINLDVKKDKASFNLIKEKGQTKLIMEIIQNG